MNTPMTSNGGWTSSSFVTTTEIKTFTPQTHAYEAINENPRVFCSSGPTPYAALAAMCEICLSEGIYTWSASAVHFDDEGTHYLTIYV